MSVPPPPPPTGSQDTSIPATSSAVPLPPPPPPTPGLPMPPGVPSPTGVPKPNVPKPKGVPDVPVPPGCGGFANLDNLDKEKEIGISYNIDKITDKIYLGGIKGLSENDYFQKEKINAILSVTNELPDINIDVNIKRKIIEIDDLFSENIIKYFKECIDFIENNGKIFIHCTCGVSRSASIVIAYLMWKTHSTFNNTYLFVKKRRPEIDPNNGFRKQLNIFHKLLEENDYNLDKIEFEKII